MYKKFEIPYKFLLFFAFLMPMLTSCGDKTKQGVTFKYELLKKSLISGSYAPHYDTANLFDSKAFIPGKDSFEILLERIGTLWRMEEELMENGDSLNYPGKEVNYTTDDRIIIKENVRTLDSFLNKKNTKPAENCYEKECMVYVEIVKSTQQLYLYLDGEIRDSFKVSTGIKGRETPNLSTRPTGPMFIKYTSKKFPGGNYEGLGNMPYAIFIKGGFAIHGTTQGNFAFLGTPASHGCIRLHPLNAKILFELVKETGLENTWIKVMH